MMNWNQPHRCLCWLSTVALTFGCQFGANLENLAKELGNPDKGTFDAPGDLYLEGTYRAVGVDGTSSTGPFITALRSDAHLVIMPFDSVKECDVGPVRAFRPALVPGKQSKAEDVRMPFIASATDETSEQLRFTDFRCNISKTTLDSSLLPLSDSFTEDDGLIAQAADGGIWYVNPWTEDKKQVAFDTSAVSRDSNALFADGTNGKRWMFTLEQSVIVGRDEKFAEAFRSQAGFDVFVHHKSADKSIVVVARRWERLPDSEDSIPVWYSVPLDAPDQEIKVAENACSMRVNDGTQGRELIFADCATGDLLHYLYKTSETRTLANEVEAYRMIGNADDGPILMYVERDATSTKDVGPLYARWGFNDPSFLGENGHLKLSWISTGGTERPVVDWSNDSGTLKYGKVGSDLKTIAKGVVYVSSLGVISDYDGNNGVFSRLSGSELTEVYDSVNVNGIRPDSETERLLMLSDFSDGRGSLLLINGNEKRVLAEDVQPNAYQYAASVPMVSVLHNFDQESSTATLVMVRTDRVEELEIATGVKESLEIGWPEQGLLYSAPAAEPPGIYFSKAR